MATCPQCHNEVSEGVAFCPNCGSALAAPAAAEAVSEVAAAVEPAVEVAETTQSVVEPVAEAAVTAPVATDAPAAPAVPAPEPAPVAEPAPAAQQPAAQQAPVFDSTQAYAAAPAAAVPGQPTYAQKSALGRAWDDFKASPHKMKTLFKLAFAQFLPGVGSIMLDGYSVAWGKERALGRDTAMPEKLIRPGVLDAGLYAYLVQLIVCVVLMIVCAIVGGIFDAINLDVIGSLFQAALMIIAAPLICVMVMRGAICCKVSPALKVGPAVDAGYKNGRFGKSLVAALVPGLIFCLVAIVVVIIVFIVAMVMGFGASAATSAPYYYSDSYMSYAYSSGPSEALLGGMAFVFVLLVIVAAFVLFFAYAISAIVTYRAYGYLMEDLNPAQWPEYQENSGKYAKEAL